MPRIFYPFGIRSCEPATLTVSTPISDSAFRTNTISEHTYKEIMAKSNDRDALVKSLVELASQVGTDGKSKIPSFLIRLKRME